MSEEDSTEASPEGEAQSYRERYAEVDVDRGVAVGAIIGVAMFVAIQGMLVLSVQTGIIGRDVPPLAPLALAGVTQLVYVFPTVLFFINRRCPLMTKGYLAVAGVVVLFSLLMLLFG